MKQQTLGGFEKYGKTTRRAQFLAEMDRVVPWPELAAAIEPHYPKASMAGGRPPVPLERMLRIYFLQLWFNLSDPAVEEALYDSEAMRRFVGIDLGQEAAPDETTVCKFRHLLERNGLGKTLLTAINRYLHENGIKIAKGTIVDATIISAPSSTKNKSGGLPRTSPDFLPDFFPVCRSHRTSNDFFKHLSSLVRSIAGSNSSSEPAAIPGKR